MEMSDHRICLKCLNDTGTECTEECQGYTRNFVLDCQVFNLNPDKEDINDIVTVQV